jgi:putative hydrolase of the HAD superfamily
VAARGGTEGGDAFAGYLRAVLAELPAAWPLGPAGRERLVHELAPALRSHPTDRLWCEPMPRVRESLEALRALDLRLVVVSNSDGTVERALAEQGLRAFFHAVLDSHVIGFEKPDPRIFHAALDRAGSAPGRTLHVGDIYDADVVGARAAGIHPLLLDPYGDWEGVDCERSPDLWCLAERLRAARRAATGGPE